MGNNDMLYKIALKKEKKEFVSDGLELLWLFVLPLIKCIHTFFWSWVALPAGEKSCFLGEVWHFFPLLRSLASYFQARLLASPVSGVITKVRALAFLEKFGFFSTFDEKSGFFLTSQTSRFPPEKIGFF